MEKTKTGFAGTGVTSVTVTLLNQETSSTKLKSIETTDR